MSGAQIEAEGMEGEGGVLGSLGFDGWMGLVENGVSGKVMMGLLCCWRPGNDLYSRV